MAIKPHNVDELDPQFNFIIPTYNAGTDLIKCIKSIQAQDYDDWRAVVIDDCSTDDSLKLARNSIHDDPRIDLITNPINAGAAYSRYRGIHHICRHPDDICLLLDGDDRLLGHKALDIIKEAYDSGAEATHGTYRDRNHTIPTGDYSDEVKQNRSYRSVEWKVKHMRTFRYKYFRYIPSYQFKDDNNNWLKTCTDLAIMFPVLEQVPGDKFVYIEVPIYHYNSELRNLRRYGKPRKRKDEKLIRSKNFDPQYGESPIKDFFRSDV